MITLTVGARAGDGDPLRFRLTAGEGGGTSAGDQYSAQDGVCYSPVAFAAPRVSLAILF
jgi:hypothetical protein